MPDRAVNNYCPRPFPPIPCLPPAAQGHYWFCAITLSLCLSTRSMKTSFAKHLLRHLPFALCRSEGRTGMESDLPRVLWLPSGRAGLEPKPIPFVLSSPGVLWGFLELD